MRRLQEKQPTYSVTKWNREFHDIEKIRNNVCEYRYEFDDRNSKSRFTLTTAQHDTGDGAFNSLPRISSGQPGTRGPFGQQNYNTMYQSSSGTGLRYGRGASAGPTRQHAIIR